MKTTKKIQLVFAIAFITTNCLAQELSEMLSPLELFVKNTWTGKLKSPDGTMEFKVDRTFEVMNKGNVIKCTKINKELDNYGEGFFYWNDIEKKIAFFFIESSGVFQNGFVTVEKNTVTIEGTMTWPKQMNPQVKQSYNFRNTFELTTDGKLLDRWYMDAFGDWRPGHVIEFVGE